MQGQQFDKLWVRADRLFARQQAYVAITRGKTFDSVYVTNLALHALHAVTHVNEAAIGWVKAIIANQGSTPDVPLSVEELMPTTTCFALSLLEPRLAAVYRRIMHPRNPQWRGLFGNTGGGGGDAERAGAGGAGAVTAGVGGAALDIDAGEAAGAEEAEDAVAAAEAEMQEAEAGLGLGLRLAEGEGEAGADPAPLTGRKRGRPRGKRSAGAAAIAGDAADGGSAEADMIVLDDSDAETEPEGSAAKRTPAAAGRRSSSAAVAAVADSEGSADTGDGYAPDSESSPRLSGTWSSVDGGRSRVAD